MPANAVNDGGVVPAPKEHAYQGEARRGFLGCAPHDFLARPRDDTGPALPDQHGKGQAILSRHFGQDALHAGASAFTDLSALMTGDDFGTHGSSPHRNQA